MTLLFVCAPFGLSGTFDVLKFCIVFGVVKSKEWAVVFNEDGIILTSHKIENVFEPFEDKHKRFGATVKKVL